MKGSRALRALFFGAATVVFVATLNLHAVDKDFSEEDRQYIPKYLEGIAPLPEKPTYAHELEFIRSVQRSVLTIARDDGDIPLDQKREPKELYVARTGSCFDRSRVIEKILTYSGFKTRHVAIYSMKETGSGARSILTPGAASHAVTEALTTKGWLVIDSNDPWLATDASANPVSIEKIQSRVARSVSTQLSTEPPTTIYVEPFTFVYGLYSRHGRFYPPYDMIPDLNYSELIQNVL